MCQQIGDVSSIETIFTYETTADIKQNNLFSHFCTYWVSSVLHSFFFFHLSLYGGSF